MSKSESLQVPFSWQFRFLYPQAGTSCPTVIKGWICLFTGESTSWLLQGRAHHQRVGKDIRYRSAIQCIKCGNRIWSLKRGLQGKVFDHRWVNELDWIIFVLFWPIVTRNQFHTKTNNLGQIKHIIDVHIRWIYHRQNALCWKGWNWHLSRWQWR